MHRCTINAQTKQHRRTDAQHTHARHDAMIRVHTCTIHTTQHITARTTNTSHTHRLGQSTVSRSSLAQGCDSWFLAIVWELPHTMAVRSEGPGLATGAGQLRTQRWWGPERSLFPHRCVHGPNCHSSVPEYCGGGFRLDSVAPPRRCGLVTSRYVEVRRRCRRPRSPSRRVCARP